MKSKVKDKLVGVYAPGSYGNSRMYRVELEEVKKYDGQG